MRKSFSLSYVWFPIKFEGKCEEKKRKIKNGFKFNKLFIYFFY